MKLTPEILAAGKSSAGGWNKEQMAILGLTYPLIPGWRKTVMGREFPDEELKRFVQLKDAHFKTAVALQSRLDMLAKRNNERLARRAKEAAAKLKEKERVAAIKGTD